MLSAAPYSIISSVIGMFVTAATQQRYGRTLWNLLDLLSTIIQTGGSRSRAAAFFAGAALFVINIPGNAFSGRFDFAAALSSYINIRRSACITALPSSVVNPWRLPFPASTFLSVLSSYTVFLGPMIGLMITSYFRVHTQKIRVYDLFRGDKGLDLLVHMGHQWEASHRFFPAKGVDAFVKGPMNKHQTMKYYQGEWDAYGLPE